MDIATVTAVLDATGHTGYTLTDEGAQAMLTPDLPRPARVTRRDSPASEKQANRAYHDALRAWKEALHQALGVAWEHDHDTGRIRIRPATAPQDVDRILDDAGIVLAEVFYHYTDRNTALAQPYRGGPEALKTREGDRAHRRWVQRAAAAIEAVPGWSARVDGTWVMARRDDSPGDFPAEPRIA